MGPGEIIIIILLVIIGGVLTQQIVLSRGLLKAKRTDTLPPAPKDQNTECYAEVDNKIQQSESKSSREFIYEAVYLDGAPAIPVTPISQPPNPVFTPPPTPPISPVAPPPAKKQKVAIFFEVGDYAGNEIELTGEDLVIGRNPQKANLILKSSQVSGSHVSISLSPDGSVVVQDLDSLNGTYYLSPQAQHYISWEELAGKKVLNQPVQGSLGRIRIGEDIAVFEIRKY